MKKIAFVFFLALLAVPARAEIRSIDITIFGMD
jgi:hypothetical protein